MKTIALAPDEAADYEEYKRRRRALELRGKLRALEPTLLRKNASLTEIRNLCAQAKRLSSVCVCIQPVYVKTCKILLKNTDVGVNCIVGGNSESALTTKLCEIKTALREGATEFELFPCVSAVINGNFTYFKREIKRVKRAAKGKVVKVCLDAYLIQQDRFLRAAQIASDCGVNFLCVRAEEDIVTLLEQRLKKSCSIKAYGVETPAVYRSMLSLGCSRIGSELAEEIAQAMEDDVNGVLKIETKE